MDETAYVSRVRNRREGIKSKVFIAAMQRRPNQWPELPGTVLPSIRHGEDGTAEQVCAGECCHPSAVNQNGLHVCIAAMNRKSIDTSFQMPLAAFPPLREPVTVEMRVKRAVRHGEA